VFIRPWEHKRRTFEQLGPRIKKLVPIHLREAYMLRDDRQIRGVGPVLRIRVVNTEEDKAWRVKAIKKAEEYMETTKGIIAWGVEGGEHQGVMLDGFGRSMEYLESVKKADFDGWGSTKWLCTIEAVK
jgi:hypothetical protein